MAEFTATLPEKKRSDGSNVFSQSFFVVVPGIIFRGDHVMRVTGLPEDTVAVSAWVTERLGNSETLGNAGGAVFKTTSVQLYDNNTACRIHFEHDWNTPLTAAAMVIVGLGG